MKREHPLPESQINKFELTDDYNIFLTPIYTLMQVYADVEPEKLDGILEQCDMTRFPGLRPMPHYDDMYLSTEKHQVITKRNKRRVQRINELVDTVNGLSKSGCDEPNAYGAIIGRIYFWLNGKYHPDIPRDALRFDFSTKE